MEQPSGHYAIIPCQDAKEQQLPGHESILDEAWYNVLYELDDQGKPIRYVGDDGGEPEDKILYRDLKWVVAELERLAQQNDHLKHGIREGTTRLHQIAQLAKHRRGDDASLENPFLEIETKAERGVEILETVLPD